MGAHDISRDLPGTLTQLEVRKEFDKWHAEDRAYHGQDPYSGSWATINSITFPTNEHFGTFQEAYDYCLDKSQKWEFACAVKYLHLTRTQTKAPTFLGKPHKNDGMVNDPVIIRHYPPSGYGSGVDNSRLIAADQLREEVKVKLLDLFEKDRLEGRDAQAAQQALTAYLRALEKPETTFEPKQVRELRKASFAALKRYAKTHHMFTELADTYRKRLYAYDEKRDLRWLVCGWAAS